MCIRDRTELLNKKVEYPKIIKDSLLDNQIELLRHLEVQILTSKYASSVGLLHPKFVEKLALSKEQQETMQSLADTYAKQAKLLLAFINEERAEIQKTFESDVESLLKEPQLKLYRQLTGQWETSK